MPTPTAATYVKTIDIDGVKQVILNWITAVLNPGGAPVDPNIVEDFAGNTKLTNYPFVIYKIGSPDIVSITDDLVYGLNNPLDPTSGSDLQLEGLRKYNVTVQAFGDEGTEDANMITGAMQTSFLQPQFYSIFEQGGAQLTPPQAFFCSVGKVYPVQDLTQKLDEGKWERRSVLEFELLVSYQASQVGGQILEVKSSGNVGGVPVSIDASNQ